MRTALIAARKQNSDGRLRAMLPLAGRSVLARQIDMLRGEAGCERFVCLCPAIDAETLAIQQEIEAAGGTFQVLRGFLHLPALVRADDELVVLADGLLPGSGMVRAFFETGPQPPRFVAALPSSSQLVSRHPEDFERIDATRHWAGLLAMRGAPVQQLADFPPDADAVSLLLRMALQAGTPCRELPGSVDAPGQWLLADDNALLAEHERALIIAAAASPDWRAPASALAHLAARKTPPGALAQRALIATIAGLVLLVVGAGLAGSGKTAAGLALAAGGALAGAFALALARLRERLVGSRSGLLTPASTGLAVDGLAALAVLLALSPWPRAEALAVLGPVAIGLARLLNRWVPGSALGPVAERPVLLVLLAMAGPFGRLPEATALFALILLAGLLLREPRN